MMHRTSRIRTKEFSAGTWLTTGSPVIAELAGMYRFDWVLFDLEHGSFTEEKLLSNFQALQNKDTAIIVRVGTVDAALIARVLDWGADGIMVPHVSNAIQAAACVNAMYYPPAGNRGFSRSVRAHAYGLQPPNDPASVKPLLFAQIEDKAGVENAGTIASVEGVDVLFVGPADLKLALATEGKAPSYDEALETVLRSCREHNKKAGILTRDYTEIEPLRKKGFSCLGINSDMNILKNGYQEIMDIIYPS